MKTFHLHAFSLLAKFENFATCEFSIANSFFIFRFQFAKRIRQESIFVLARFMLERSFEVREPFVLRQICRID